MAAAIIGALAAVIFAISWFRFIAGNCGVVRFYEQLYGIVILVAWLAVTAVGVWLARKGPRSKPWVGVFGTGLTMVACLGMVGVCVKTVVHIRYMDFPAKTTATLLEIAKRPGAKARDSAILELGLRKVTESAPMLCAILENEQAARADRSSAANALGRICEHPCPENVNKDRVLSALVAALQNAKSDPYRDAVVYQAVWALGQTRDIRAVGPIEDLICDTRLPQYVWEAAIGALHSIGGAQARQALESKRDTCKHGQTRAVIDDALDKMKPELR
ncbi:MAG: HEAT repeat domain-containing protein [Desulfobacterales bacterium]|nr:HEAT repeat domain-containing protein [Desulfobacterales bacterium]